MTSENDQEWVTLISEDNYRFVLDYKCAMGSGMIKNMLSGGFSEGENNTARILARGVVLEKVVEYLIWKTKYEDVKESEVPSFQNRIPPEISLELLMCADFLEV